MKVTVTQKGVRIGGKAITKGEVLEIDGDKVPPSLVNKVEAAQTKKVAVTNPAAKDGFTASAAERQARMKELVSGLDKAKDFTTDGAPEVHALNALLNEGEQHFTAKERDQLWPGIAKG